MPELQIETLAKIEQDWKAVFTDPQEGFRTLGAMIRRAWELQDQLVLERDRLKGELTNKPATQPLDEIERKALKQDIDQKQQKIIDLERQLVDMAGAVQDIRDQATQFKNKLELTGDELLSYYLDTVEKKFQQTFDEAIQANMEGKLSEYTITLVTMAHEFIFCAKKAYLAALKEDKDLLERPANKQVGQLTMHSAIADVTCSKCQTITQGLIRQYFKEDKLERIEDIELPSGWEYREQAVGGKLPFCSRCAEPLLRIVDAPSTPVGVETPTPTVPMEAPAVEDASGVKLTESEKVS